MPRGGRAQWKWEAARSDETESFGSDGAGEAGTVGALPAVMNAIMDALAPLGVKELDMSATSDRVWRAIQEALSS